MFKNLTFIIALMGFVSQGHASSGFNAQDIASLNRLSTFTSAQHTANLLGQDVHKFNAQIRPLAPLVKRFNQLLKLDRAVDANVILDNLKALRIAHNLDPACDAEIVRLKSYLAKKLDYDGETNMKITELLNAIWNYLTWNQYLQQAKNVGIAVPLGELFFYLQQNTQEQGGCFPGYAGRLMLLNARFILEFHQTISVCPDMFTEMLQEWSEGKCCK